MAHVAERAADRVTRAYIARNPSSVVVLRRSRIDTASGGRKWSGGTELDPQDMRLVPVRSVGDLPPTRTMPDGKQVIIEWMVIAPGDADIEVGDILIIGDVRYLCVYPTTSPTWRKCMEVIQHAE